jgi:uncharacterized damage-inducible protein DinB
MTLQDYLSYFDDVVRPTEQLFRLIPADKLDWKPTDNSFSLGQQIAHIAGALGVYARGIARGDWGFKSMRERFVLNRRTPTMTVEEAIYLLNENCVEFRKIVGALSEEEFDKGEVDSPQLGRAPRWRLAMLAVEHHINHKAELFMALKQLGVAVNTGNLYARE